MHTWLSLHNSITFIFTLLLSCSSTGAALHVPYEHAPASSIRSTIEQSSLSTSTALIAETTPLQEDYKAPRENWLYDLPAEASLKVREFLMGASWPRHKELVCYKLSPSRAAQVCKNIKPLQPLFSNPLILNKRALEHPDYGILSIDRANKDEPETQDMPQAERQRTTVYLTSKNRVTSDKAIPLSYTVNDADASGVQAAYFAPDHETIIVEYTSRFSDSHYYMLLDAQTLQPKIVTIRLAYDRDATQIALEDIHNTQGSPRIEHRGVPYAISRDNRYIVSECNGSTRTCIIDLETCRGLRVRDDTVRRPGHTPCIYQEPATKSALKIHSGNSLTFFDHDTHTRIARYTLPASYMVHGYIDDNLLRVDDAKDNNPQTRNTPRPQAIVVTTPEHTMALRRMQPHPVTCMLFEGILSSATETGSSKEIHEDHKRTTLDEKACRQGFNARRNILETLPLMSTHSRLARFARSFPSLAQRYLNSFTLLEHPVRVSLAEYICKETVNDAATLYKQDPTFSMQTALQSCLTNYYVTRIDSFKDFRHIEKDMYETFPALQHGALPTMIVETVVDQIHRQQPSFPKVRITSETIAEDMRSYCSNEIAVHYRNSLESALLAWFCAYYAAKKDQFFTLQAIERDLTTTYNFSALTPAPRALWCMHLQDALKIPYLHVTLENLEECLKEISAISSVPQFYRDGNQNVDEQIEKVIFHYYVEYIEGQSYKNRNPQVHEQIKKLIISYYCERQSQYPDTFSVLKDLKKRFPSYTRVPPFQRTAILRDLSKINIDKPFVITNKAFLEEVFKLTESILSPNDELKTLQECAQRGIIEFINKHTSDPIGSCSALDFDLLKHIITLSATSHNEELQKAMKNFIIGYYVHTQKKYQDMGDIITNMRELFPQFCVSPYYEPALASINQKTGYTLSFRANSTRSLYTNRYKPLIYLGAAVFAVALYKFDWRNVLKKVL